jgi:hypothetical protein
MPYYCNGPAIQHTSPNLNFAWGCGEMFFKFNGTAFHTSHWPSSDVILIQLFTRHKLQCSSGLKSLLFIEILLCAIHKINWFCISAGLSHDDCMHKMRLLTFMQIAEGKSEVSYEAIQQELLLESDQVEAFIIDGLFICSFE